MKWESHKWSSLLLEVSQTMGHPCFNLISWCVNHTMGCSCHLTLLVITGHYCYEVGYTVGIGAILLWSGLHRGHWGNIVMKWVTPWELGQCCYEVGYTMGIGAILSWSGLHHGHWGNIVKKWVTDWGIIIMKIVLVRKM